MDPRSASVRRIVCDLTCIALLGTPILLLFLVGKPTHRGFFCDDESLRHPYNDSTVPSYYLYIIGFGANIAAMFIVESYRSKIGLGPSEVSFGNRTIPGWMWNVYVAATVMAFGAGCSHLTTDSVKYTVGRLRPHFYTVCLPQFKGPDGSLTTCDRVGPNFHDYITDYTCTNALAINNRRIMKEMRLSFPSGHSSFSMYSMMYLAIYLHMRLKTTYDFKLVKYVIQFGLILLAVVVGMTRIFDYKHHWSDVLTGFAIGATSAIIVTRIVLPYRRKPDQKALLEPTELPQMNSNGNGSV